MEIVVHFDDLITLSGGIEKVVYDVGSIYDDNNYSKDLSVYEQLSKIVLIEIPVENGYASFGYNGSRFKFDMKNHDNLSDLINSLSSRGIAFEFLDDTVYLEDNSIYDLRFRVTLHHRIDFYFDFSDNEKSFILTRVTFREPFVQNSFSRHQK